MKNEFINKFKSVIKINIKGKNIERFIKRLASNKIEILNIKYISYNNINIKIYQKDYEKVLELKSIYEITNIDNYGIIKIRKTIKKNSILIVCILIGIVFLYILSKTIFSIEIIHNDKNIRQLISKEIEHYNMAPISLAKSYKQLEQIKKDILKKHKDKVEWLEIEKLGTKYIIRLEERKLNPKTTTNKPRHIIAKKDAVIKRIDASKGEIVKKTDQYVKKGDTIISGDIILNEQVKESISAEGKVYGEVWYQVTVEYPFAYNENKETGKSKNIYTLKFLNKELEFTLNKYKNKITEEKTILKNNLIPLKLVKQHQREVEKISKLYTYEEAVLMAEKEAKTKIQSKLNTKEEVISQKTLKILRKDSKIEVVVFLTVLEDITDYINITKQTN